MKRSMLVLAVFTLLGMGTATGLAEARAQRRGHLQTRFLGVPGTVNSTVPSKKNASSRTTTIRTPAPAKPGAKSQPLLQNATVPQGAPHLLASQSMDQLVGEVDKFLDFFVKPESLELDYKKFKEMYPTEGEFSPACLAHVHRLVNKIDLSYTDVQLGHVLENECGLMKHFQYVVVDQFGSKKDCKKFAEVLVAARDEELSSGKMTGYTKFCSDYYEFQVNRSAPVANTKSVAALQRISFLVVVLSMLPVLFMF